jgi:hypothetical protein
VLSHAPHWTDRNKDALFWLPIGQCTSYMLFPGSPLDQTH